MAVIDVFKRVVAWIRPASKPVPQIGQVWLSEYSGSIETVVGFRTDDWGTRWVLVQPGAVDWGVSVYPTPQNYLLRDWRSRIRQQRRVLVAINSAPAPLVVEGGRG